MGQGSYWNFINFIQRELRAGKSRVELPAELLQGVSKEAMAEGKALAKLSGAKIISVGTEM